MLARLTLIAALACGSAAAAQTAPAVPTVTPEQAADARARADRIIADAGAEGLFVNTTTDGVAHVTHVASGMVCLFDREGEDRILIFPTGPGGMPRGDDVGCVSIDERGGVETTTYASRFRPLPEAGELLRAANTAIRRRWPDAVPYDGELVSMTMEGVVAPATSAFTVPGGEAGLFTMTLISNAGEWSYKVRITGPAAEAREVSFQGALAMINIQLNLKGG